MAFADNDNALTVQNMQEEKLLMRGVSFLHQSREPTEEALVEVPRRPNGSPLVTRFGFFERLLRKQVDFQSCHQSDISNAQFEVRHLSLDQMLALRVLTIDFAGHPSAHASHRAFVATVQKYLLEKTVKHLFRGAVPEARQEMQAKALRDVGARMLVVLGFAAIHSTAEAVPKGPSRFAIDLVAQALLWPESSAALFHVRELWAEALPDSQPERAASLQGAETIGILYAEPAASFKKTRLMDWKVRLVATAGLLDEVKLTTAGAASLLADAEK